MIHPRSRVLEIIAILLAICCPFESWAAQSSGELSGSVTDQTGAVLSNVRVTASGASEREAVTSASGEFVFHSLPIGTYQISAELIGFERTSRDVQVHAGARIAMSFTLHVVLTEETTVTAAKLGESDVRTLPMAVTAVPRSELARLGTRTLDGGAALAPSVTLSQNTGFAQLSIRGIGTNTLYAGADPSSALYLDGVYLARPAMAFVQFLDLERVEVLRGPQGTLYGRNAVGGAINLVSRGPTNEFEASADFTVGNLSELNGTARLSGPLKRDHVMGAVSFARAVRDGYVSDLEHPDHRLGGNDVTAARGQLQVAVNRRTALLLSSDVDLQRGVPLTFNKVLAVKPGFQVDNPPGFRDVRASARASNRTLQAGASARLTMALTPSTTLVSLTAVRTLDFEFFVDADVTELNVLTTHQHEWQHQLSQEFTISRQQSRLMWLAGAFFFHENDHQSFWVDQAAAGFQVRLDPRVEATSRAVFGQATVELTPRVSATAGIRYTDEGKDIDNAGGRYRIDMPDMAAPGSVYGYTDSISHTAWTPKIGLETKLANGSLAYLSATKGFKSGGFNPSSTAPGRGYAPEFAWSYEGGWKSGMVGGRATFDVSAFMMDYSDLQVQTPIGIGVFDIRNAAAATIRGVEVENRSRIAAGVEAGGHLTWLDATYDRYIAVANDGTTGDVAGNRLNNAPEWAGRLWIEWSAALGSARRLTIAGDASAQSTVFYTPFNDTIQRQTPYGLVGARVEYGRSDRRWTFAAYARNLTDTNYIMATFGTPPTAFGGRPGPSRQVAVELSVRR